MVCLIKSKYKEELDLYTQLLGSEKRAYAILCCNNGYTLDKTKDGKPSKLYNDLLEYYKGDVTKAVQKKAQLFTSEFTKDYGQWYQDGYEISDEYKEAFDENGEPLLHNTYFGIADNKILLDEQKEFVSTKEEEQYILEHAARDENGKLLAPNGKPSNLTEKQYAQVRTKAFKEWFGDWENDPKNASKVVDENGEPLVVYHGGIAGINIFRHSTEDESTTGYGYYNDPKTGEKIPMDSNRAMFFSSNPYVGRSYADLYAIERIMLLRGQVENILENTPEDGDFLRASLDYFKRGIQDVYDMYEALAELNPRFAKLSEYTKQLKAKGQHVQGAKNINEIRRMLIDVRNKLRKASDRYLMNRSEWEYIFSKGNKLINKYNTPKGRTSLRNGEIPESIKKEWDLYKKIEKNRERLGLTKIGNYEELHLSFSNQSGIYYLIYDGKSLKVRKDYTTTDIKNVSDKELEEFFKDAQRALHKDFKTIREEPNRKRLIEKSGFYSVFLNIRKPLAHDYEGTHQGQGYKENSKYPFGYVAARQVNKAIKEGNDGVIYQNLYDPYLANNYGVFNPNQIKSATDNVGTFSRTNDDIRYNRNDDPVSSTQMDLEIKRSILSSKLREIYNKQEELHKRQRNNVAYTGIIQTKDGPISIKSEHGDDYNIIYFDSGDSIFNRVTFNIKYNLQENLLFGSLILPSRAIVDDSILHQKSNFDRLENPIKSNYAQLLKAVLQYFIDNGKTNMYTQWTQSLVRGDHYVNIGSQKVLSKDDSQEMRIEILSKILNVDIIDHFKYENRLDHGEGTREDHDKVQERENINIVGLMKSIPLIGNFKEFDIIKTAMQSASEDKTNKQMMKQLMSSQLESLDNERNDINKKIEDIDQQLRMLKYQQMGSYKYGTQDDSDYELPFNRNANKKDEINENVTDSISQNTQRITKDEALKIFQKLQSVIPSLKEIKFLSDEETLRMTGGVRANAFVKNGIVYINKAGFNSKDTVIEECLHSFVNDLSIENKRLFNSLLRRATKDFPKLVSSIFENYSDKDGFTQEDRNQELVTQVLSRYMRKELENPSKSLLQNIQNFITWLVEKLQKLFKDPKTGKYIIDANFFINGMTFEDIAKILNSNNVQLNVHDSNQIKYNRNSKKRIQKAKDKVKAKLKEGIHIVGTRDSTQKLIDKLSQDIILGTRSKNKAYSSKRNSSVSYGNERQIARNQEAVNFADEQAKTINEAIAERDAEKQLTEQAKLILDFIDHADSDINEVLQMLKNAQDNDYDLIYYNVDQFGNRLYQDPSGNSITAQTAGNNTIAKQFSFDDIQYMTTDILGYYQKLLTDIDNMLLQVPVGKNAVIDEIRDLMQSLRLHDQLRAASNMKRQAQEKMLDFYIDQRINQQESSELTDEMKQRLSINMKKWVKSQYDFGDVGSFAVWTQLVSDSKSPIVRMMADEIYTMNQEIDSAIVPRGEELEKALKEAENEMSILGNHNPVNVMTMLMQKDRRGYYNGDFVQPINRRQYFQDLEDFKTALLFGKGGLQDQLKKKIGNDFELELDEYGEPAIPTDTEFDDIYKDYKRKMETFICDHANRRFTKEYYLSRIDTLSPTTLRILDQFSRKISNLKNSATVDGKFRPDLLSSKQRAELTQLQKDRQELSNPYDQFGELKDPDSVEGIVAKELNDWQNVINGKIKYKSDVEAFNECLNNIQSQAEKDQFKRMFAYVGLNPNMYNFLASYEYIGQDDSIKQLIDEIRELRKKLHKLIGINKDRSSYLGYNWEQLFDIRTGKIVNEKLLTEIRNIDDQLQLKSQMLRTIRESDKEDQNTFNDKWQLTPGIPYGRLFTQMYYGSVNIDPTQNSTQTVYSPDYDTVYEVVRNNYINYLVSKGMSTQDATDKASEMLTVGNNTPLSIFMVQMPSSKTFKYEDENGVEHNEPSFVWVPNQLFSKVDTENSSSMFVNKHFDESSGESVQPDEDYYRDDRYYEMIKHPKLKNLYDKLVKGMEDVYSMLPYSGKYDMRLPQMGANTAAMLTRNLSNDYGFHFASNLWSAFNRFANATEIDTDYYIPEYNRRPDGSTIKNIPIRYINRIDDSRNISSDLAGGVIAMLKMATNYNVKSKHISKFESILNSIKENDVGESNQSRVVEGMLDRLMYENQNNTKKNKDVEDISKIRRIFIGGPKTLLKRLGIARGASTRINLAGRGVSMIVSFLDPLLSTFIESITGRYYGARDLMCGVFDTCREFPLMLASISRRKSFSKTMAIIDALGMEKPVEHRFSNMHHSSIRRLFSDNLMMKGFEVGDYTIKAFNVNSIFRTYRMYTDGNGQVSFLNKYDYIQRCIQDGMSKKDAIKAYKSARNARSYLYVKNGSLAFKSGMTEDQFRKLGNAAKKISQNITLMANTEDKTWMQTNPWTAFITMLRTFMLVGFGERFKNFNDFIVGTDERYDPTTGNVITDISDRNLTSREIKQQKKQHYYRGGYNFMTGHIENGIYMSNLKALKRLVWDAQKHRIRFNRFFLKYSNMTQEELKKSDISMAELYSLKRILLELSVVAGCVTMSVLVNRHCQGLDPDDDDNYWWFLLNSIFMRIGIERVTMYNPQTVSDLITSITTLTSATSKLFGAFDVLGDFLGLTDHDPNEIITSNSAYNGYTRSYRATMNALSIFGTAGWFATMPKSLGGGGARALDKSAGWYAKTAPWRLLYKNQDAGYTPVEKDYKDPSLATDDISNSDLATDDVIE